MFDILVKATQLLIEAPNSELRKVNRLCPAVLSDSSKTKASKRKSLFLEPIKTGRGNLKVSGHPR